MASAILFGAACAIDDGANTTSSGSVGSDASRGAGVGDAAADSALSSGATTMYHRVGVIDPTTLELARDGTFRWVTNGCDFVHADGGRWIDEAGSVVLLPRAGRAGFRWPGYTPAAATSVESLVSPLSRVVLRRNGTRLDAVLEVDGGTEVNSSWDPGARCPQCGGGSSGSVGPSGERECDDPFRGVTLMETLAP